MPRDGTGVYTLPPGNPVITGTLIQSAWANPTMSDLGDEIEDSLSRDGKGGMRAPLVLIDGSMALPALVSSLTPSTGLYFPLATEMIAAISGQDRWRVTLTDGPQAWDGAAWQNIMHPGRSDAIDVAYSNTVSGLVADNVQDAIDELEGAGGISGGANIGIGPGAVFSGIVSNVANYRTFLKDGPSGAGIQVGTLVNEVSITWSGLDALADTAALGTSLIAEFNDAGSGVVKRLTEGPNINLTDLGDQIEIGATVYTYEVTDGADPDLRLSDGITDQNVQVIGALGDATAKTLTIAPAAVFFLWGEFNGLTGLVTTVTAAGTTGGAVVGQVPPAGTQQGNFFVVDTAGMAPNGDPVAVRDWIVWDGVSAWFGLANPVGGSITNAVNVGSGAGSVRDILLGVLNIRSIQKSGTSGTGIAVVESGDEIDIEWSGLDSIGSPPTPGDSLVADANDGGIGRLKRLIEGANIAFDVDGDAITINATGGNNVGVGTGEVFRDVAGGNANFRTLLVTGSSPSGLAVTTTADEVELEFTGLSTLTDAPSPGFSLIHRGNEDGVGIMKRLVEGTGIEIVPDGNAERLIVNSTVVVDRPRTFSGIQADGTSFSSDTLNTIFSGNLPASWVGTQVKVEVTVPGHEFNSGSQGIRIRAFAGSEANFVGAIATRTFDPGSGSRNDMGNFHGVMIFTPQVAAFTVGCRSQSPWKISNTENHGRPRCIFTRTQGG